MSLYSLLSRWSRRISSAQSSAPRILPPRVHFERLEERRLLSITAYTWDSFNGGSTSAGVTADWGTTGEPGNWNGDQSFTVTLSNLPAHYSITVDVAIGASSYSGTSEVTLRRPSGMTGQAVIDGSVMEYDIFETAVDAGSTAALTIGGTDLRPINSSSSSTNPSPFT